MDTTPAVTAKIITPAHAENAMAVVRSVTLHEQPNVFLSGDWQECWLLSMSTLPNIISFKAGNQPIGYATIGRYKPSNLLPHYVSLINQSGNRQFDQIWIEFNSIVCDDTMLTHCINALFDELFKQHRCARIVLSMCENTSAWLSVCRDRDLRFSEDKVNAYRAILPEGSNDTALIDSFSANTRQQLRRGIRRAHDIFGDITITAACANENIQYWEALARLHIAKWAKTNEGSGFNNPHFLKHHERFIKQHPDKICLLKLSAGKEVLGYGYYLLSNNNMSGNSASENTVTGDTASNNAALFYCAGLNQSIDDNTVKPGYLLHFYAMEYFRARGLRQYDFMAGEFRYKRSLSNQSYSMTTLTIYNSHPIAKGIEAIWRYLKKYRPSF